MLKHKYTFCVSIKKVLFVGEISNTHLYLLIRLNIFFKQLEVFINKRRRNKNVYLYNFMSLKVSLKGIQKSNYHKKYNSLILFELIWQIIIIIL